ncbi:MAG: bifunctional diaminohydroxyphosphoribosylaminopyrimidine deaminase/5-amino-6-(5-phosphoribosylamino)uracil reductase RibD [Candidatus Eremiobacteraeota bacterium]|nr:bifunctional diaminohydroxyphosphoribosylaminopyrimidine deaminase/5-amino-6-(5-phosphoribosylamino)uracil reductase RibD [Candidatus Eremiobacteraeota bacterium]
MDDERAMELALELAKKGLAQTSPNPMVGAVVVAPGGEIVGRGYYERMGSEHAETVALRDAGDRARGATLYVTLEPCSHVTDTRPIACADRVATAGIARVVAAMEDPDPRVRGGGFARLRAQDVAVEIGVLAEQASVLNRAFVHHRLTGTPFVTLKMAQSLDGTIVSHRGERRQLTGARAQRHTRLARYEHDAVMVGVGTVIVDDPLLTVRPRKPRAVPYRRIVVDAVGRIPLRAKVTKDQARAPTIVATTDQMPQPTRDELTKRGVTVLMCAKDGNDRVDLRDLLTRLGRDGIISILCEGGPILGASLLTGQHVQAVDWLVAPLLLGGQDAVPVIADVTRDIPLRLRLVRRLGDDVLITGEVAG